MELGLTVRDRITKFQGVATGRAEYLTGCRQILVEGMAKEGETAKSHWFDESRLAVIEGEEVGDFRDLQIVAPSDKGGPQPLAPIR